MFSVSEEFEFRPKLVRDDGEEVHGSLSANDRVKPVHPETDR